MRARQAHLRARPPASTPSSSKRGISADTALRLGRFFGNSPQFWLNLQNHHDLQLAEEALAEGVEGAVPMNVEEVTRTGRGHAR